MQSLPYELRALEAALSTVAKILEREVKSLEDTLAPGERVLCCGAGGTAASLLLRGYK